MKVMSCAKYVFSFHIIACSLGAVVPPDGWCDLRYGTPTRTTGECICKSECYGSGCQRAQGFIWYSYASCPNCKCISATTNDRTIGKETREEVDRAPLSEHIDKDEIKYDSDESFVDIMLEWLDDNFRIIFACTISAVFIGFLILFFWSRQPT